MKIQWLLQKNLTNEKDLENLKMVIKKDGETFEEIIVIPFSDEIHYTKEEEMVLVLYGSTTMMWNGYCHPFLKKGVFFEKKLFNMKAYQDNWKELMLNHEGFFLTVKELLENHYENENATYFVRPNDDTKLFSGTLSTISDLKTELAPLLDVNPHITLDTLLFFSEPKEIQKEWRHFVVDGKIVSSCRYAQNGQISKDKHDLPPSMLDFTKKALERFTPHDIFVLDIAFSNGFYGILEANCFNGTGFYDHDIESIVTSVHSYLRK